MIRGFAIFCTITGELLWISPPWDRPDALLPYVRWRNRVSVAEQISIPWEELT